MGMSRDWSNCNSKAKPPSLVYEIPPGVFTIPPETRNNAAPLSPSNLREVMTTMDLKGIPPLEVRFRIAYNLARSTLRLHACDIIHGNLTPDSVIYFWRPSKGTRRSPSHTKVNLDRPRIASFDLFSERSSDGAAGTGLPGGTEHYMHWSDPARRGSKYSQKKKAHDIYRLAVILLEVGLWSVQKWAPATPELTRDRNKETIARLQGTCGSVYMAAVQACFGMAERHLEGDTKGLGESESKQEYNLLLALHTNVISRLKKCCEIDEEVGDSDNDPEDDYLSVKSYLDDQQKHRAKASAETPPVRMLPEFEPSKPVERRHSHKKSGQ